MGMGASPDEHQQRKNNTGEDPPFNTGNQRYQERQKKSHPVAGFYPEQIAGFCDLHQTGDGKDDNGGQNRRGEIVKKTSFRLFDRKSVYCFILFRIHLSSDITGSTTAPTAMANSHALASRGAEPKIP